MKSRLQRALRAAARRKRGRRAIGFGVIFTFGLLVVALTADAQPPGKISRIGYLGLAAPTPEVLHLVEALRQGLRELGYVNLKTAKALGLTIPQAILVRADEVIQ